MSGRFRDDYAIDEDICSYYGGASIPFIWESRPGTPKNNLCSDSFLPLPLTPPPSYYSSSGLLSTPKRQSKVRSKLSKFLSMSMFTNLRRSSYGSKKTTNSSFSWSSTSSSSSFSSSPPYSLKKGTSRDKKSMYVTDEEDELRSSPTSTLFCSSGGQIGCSSSMGSLKKALLSGPMASPKLSSSAI